MGKFKTKTRFFLRGGNGQGFFNLGHNVSENGLFLSFPYVCPEPVLAKSSFLYINGEANATAATGSNSSNSSNSKQQQQQQATAVLPCPSQRLGIELPLSHQRDLPLVLLYYPDLSLCCWTGWLAE
jgi:hypothetical protein